MSVLDGIILKNFFAEVVELVDTQRSGRCGRKPVGVRLSPSAFLRNK